LWCSRSKKLRRGGSRARERSSTLKADRGRRRARAATRRWNSEEEPNSRRGFLGTRVPGESAPRNTPRPSRTAGGAPEANKALLGGPRPLKERVTSREAGCTRATACSYRRGAQPLEGNRQNRKAPPPPGGGVERGAVPSSATETRRLTGLAGQPVGRGADGVKRGRRRSGNGAPRPR